MPEPRKPRLQGLYAITPDGLATADLLTRVEAALTGGARLLQYRDKRNSPTHRAPVARAIQTLCKRHGATFIINDDLSLALAIEADGVHLGGTDGDLVAARQALGPDRILGASCYADFGLAIAAKAAGADYVAFGAAFASPTKPLAPPAPHALYTRCRDEIHTPVCAIGGITLDNAAMLITAGADMLAVITDLFEAPNITQRTSSFQKLFTRGEQA